MSGSKAPGLSASRRLVKKTSAALRERLPSLLITNGTGHASEMNALLPRSRRYCWPSSHSIDSASGTNSCTTGRLSWALVRMCSAIVLVGGNLAAFFSTSVRGRDTWRSPDERTATKSDGLGAVSFCKDLNQAVDINSLAEQIKPR